MTAAAQRASLGAIGRDMALLGGDRRATALLRSLEGEPAGDGLSDLGDLAAAPDWLRAPRERQRMLARAAGLLALAPLLAASIDGAWLGALAELCGEDAIDWAIGHADAAAGTRTVQLAPDMLEPAGFGLMRAALRPGLRPALGWAPEAPATLDTSAAAALVDLAWQRCGA